MPTAIPPEFIPHLLAQAQAAAMEMYGAAAAATLSSTTHPLNHHMFPPNGGAIQAAAGNPKLSVPAPVRAPSPAAGGLFVPVGQQQQPGAEAAALNTVSSEWYSRMLSNLGQQAAAPPTSSTAAPVKHKAAMSMSGIKGSGRPAGHPSVSEDSSHKSGSKDSDKTCNYFESKNVSVLSALAAAAVVSANAAAEDVKKEDAVSVAPVEVAS